MVYNICFYDSEKDAVVVTDMDGKQLVIDCKKAETQVVFDEPEDAGILARFASRICRHGDASGRLAGLCGCVE